MNKEEDSFAERYYNIILEIIEENDKNNNINW